MVPRHDWLRLRKHWICCGLGTVCATGLAIQGCSRAPVARFKEMTSATPASADATRGTATPPPKQTAELPRPGEAVARSDSADDSWRSKLSLTGRETRREKSRRLQEEYAEIGRKVLERPSGSRDPFLDADTSSREFPSTDELAPRRPSRSEESGVLNDIARADHSGPHTSPVDRASLERRRTEEGIARTAPPVDKPSQPPGIARTTPRTADDPSSRELSRLEQLRAEVREQQSSPHEGVARTTPPAVGPASGDRGVILSQGRLREETAPAETGRSGIARVTVSTNSEANEARNHEEVALRVQSLLAAAEWQANQGNVEEAYRNVVLAQHLADHAALKFGPLDRQPHEVAQTVWEAMHAEPDLASIARTLPPPKLPPAAQRRPVPENAFAAAGSRGWRETPGNGDSFAQGTLPIISPRGSSGPAGAPAPATDTPDTALANAVTTPAESPDSPGATARSTTAPLAAPGGNSNPVSVSRIEPEPADRPAAGAIVNAHVESSYDGGPRLPGATVPAMATLPKVDRPLPAPGPMLEGPALVKSLPSPQNLSPVSARQLPPPPTAAVPNPTVPTAEPADARPPWGLVALGGAVLAIAYAFRRRFSAACVKTATAAAKSDSQS